MIFSLSDEIVTEKYNKNKTFFFIMKFISTKQELWAIRIIIAFKSVISHLPSIQK